MPFTIVHIPLISTTVKVRIFWEGHKILWNIHLTFVLCSASHKLWTLRPYSFQQIVPSKGFFTNTNEKIILASFFSPMIVKKCPTSTFIATRYFFQLLFHFWHIWNNFWAIVCWLVLLKNWQIWWLGILHPLIIDISFILSNLRYFSTIFFAVYYDKSWNWKIYPITNVIWGVKFMDF